MTFRELLAVTLIGIFLLVPLQVSAGECEDANWDRWKVAKALQQGLSKDSLLQHLEGSRRSLTAERMERILGFINEVYKLEQHQAQAWFEKHHRICADEDEA